MSRGPRSRRRGAVAAIPAIAAVTAALLGLLGGACSPERRAAEAPVRPNVIFLLLDTLRADRLSSYGYPKPTTPHLDRFAAEGLLFEQARSQASCTFPSVNSILTSRWPARFYGQPQQRVGIPDGFVSLAEILGGEGYRTIAVSASPIVRKSTSPFNLHGGFDRGFEIFDESCFNRRADCLNRRVHRHLNHLTPPGAPFFLYLHYQDVHSPYAPPSPWRERFQPKAATAAVRDWALAGNPQPILSSLLGEGPKVEPTPLEVETLSSLYDGGLAELDEQLGLLFDDLRARALLDSSIVVIASDHGEEFLEHGRILHCETQFETSIHVPLIVRLPRLQTAERHGRFTALVENLDLVPTIVDYLGLAPGVPFEGKSLRPLIERGEAVHETTESLQYALRSATDGRAKLIYDASRPPGARGRYALFDLTSDPTELRDRLAAEPDLFRRLRSRLETRLKAAEGDLSGSLDAARESEKDLKSLGYLH